jgi:very-short-patch-repair endonuclease
VLWEYLKRKPFGFKFRRQHPFGLYILDFYCHKLKWVIEVDGSIHEREDVQENDRRKETYLETKGFALLRLSNDTVLDEHSSAIRTVEQVLLQRRNTFGL